MNLLGIIMQMTEMVSQCNASLMLRALMKVTPKVTENCMREAKVPRIEASAVSTT